MITEHWQLRTDELEQILLQDINDLDCDTGYECFWQIELAIEILEKDARINLPLNDLELNKNVEEVWVKLLFGDIIDTKEPLFDTFFRTFI